MDSSSTLRLWTDLTVGLQTIRKALEDAAHSTSPKEQADQLKPFKTRPVFSDRCDDSAMMNDCKYKTSQGSELMPLWHMHSNEGCSSIVKLTSLEARWVGRGLRDA